MCICACCGCLCLFCLHLFVYLLRSQVFVPYVLCLSVRDSVTACACVGGLALAVTCVVPGALSLSPRATYLFVAHLRCAGPDTGVCQQREKQSAGNWRLTLCMGGETEWLTQR